MLESISLQNFRSYKKSAFSFSPKLTLIIGKNTAGKSNLIEAIFFLSRGKSFRTEKDQELIKEEGEFAKFSAKTDAFELGVIVSNAGSRFSKKFLINGLSRRRADFVGNLPSILFSPQDLDLVTGGPSLRRNFLDEVLEQMDKEYRLATTLYAKALRQRNSLLERVRETGIRSSQQFEYWDNLLIKNGQLITAKREEFIKFVNRSEKELFDLELIYDRSEVSEERLLQYKEAEEASGITLVGPHRDDLIIRIKGGILKSYGSRGQQRLSVLQLKMLELDFMEEYLSERPLLLLDDIFSELDSGHIKLIMENVSKQQTIITTTHKEFFAKEDLKVGEVIEL